MKLTMSSEMGIHAVWYLASLGAVQPVLSAQIAAGISVSETYLIKVLKRLVEAKVLASRKGKNGGYLLKRDPKTITLADIVRACEGKSDIYGCMHDERGCATPRPVCPICQTLTKAEEAMFRELSASTINDLLDFGWRLR